MFTFLPHSFLQMNTIFISILIEALPFVIIGTVISGIIQAFLSEKLIARMMPQRKFTGVLFGSALGVLFPSCECGIVPIVHRLHTKGVPLHTGIAFMLTAPIVNPIVFLSTYIAFGNTWEIPLLRVAGSLVVSIVVGTLVAYCYKGEALQHFVAKKTAATHHDHAHCTHTHAEPHFWVKVWHSLQHSIDEFFAVGKFLVFGALLAAAMQVYVKTSVLSALGDNKLTAILVMIVLAFVLSLCSEADAFIAASFRGLFPQSAIVAFLVFGPMIDVKNILMMMNAFKVKLTLFIVSATTVTTILFALFI
ncbi:permease [Brochothrix campestris]|uniref:permease n=1 Tax=Brochothrix campestris TaxID=2757 RepID=UPI0038CF7984